MTSLLIGIVGRAPASIVVAARALRPDRTLLVHSDDTRTVAEVVQQQLLAMAYPFRSSFRRTQTASMPQLRPSPPS